MRSLVPVLLGVLALCASCGRSSKSVRTHVDHEYPERLSEWRIFTGSQKELRPNQGVLPYDVTTSLFVNHASKFRTLSTPPGTRATYKSEGVLDLPVGSVLTKTFSFGERRIETRLYVRETKGWAGITYVWNDDQADAILDPTPAPVRVAWQGSTFDYEIPNVNQCKLCHEGPNDNGPLGITAKMLNRDGQLERWAKAGYLEGFSGKAPQSGSSLNARARDYLDVNCGSCHVVGGRGMKSGLFLTAAETDSKQLGVCKAATDVPGAFNIVPGEPARSMLLHRMRSLDRKVMMPDVGKSVVDPDGVKLIEEWIASLPGRCS